MNVTQLTEHSNTTPEWADEGVQPGHWVSVVSHLHPQYGGLSAAVPQLASSMMRTSEVRLEIAAFCAEGECYVPVEYPHLAVTYWPMGRLAWMRDGGLRKRLREEFARADGVHIHGLWEQSTEVAGRMARKLRKPYIVSAHGMLEPWALQGKRLKKKIYSALIERRNIRGASCVHALTRNEAEQCRRFGYKGPIAIIPNGVEIPLSPEKSLFLAEFPALRGKRIFLFMGRLHPKKGLDMLIEAWASVATQWPEAVLVVAGPDFQGMRAKLEEAVRKHGPEKQIVFTGMLASEMKWSALAASECFLLPSHSEGLSMSVLEAMGAGLPVIITDACNMPEVAEFETGWVIQPVVAHLVSVMSEALRNSRRTNAEIGSRGSLLVRTRYHREAVAKQMAQVYSWVLGGPVPHTVDLLPSQEL